MFCVANYAEVMKGLWAKKYSKMKQQQLESGEKTEKSTNSHGLVRRSELDYSKQVSFSFYFIFKLNLMAFWTLYLLLLHLLLIEDVIKLSSCNYTIQVRIRVMKAVTN